jgi:hypothetical protein
MTMTTEEREAAIKGVADAVSLIASAAANRQVMDPLARDISDGEREGHTRLVGALRCLTSASPTTQEREALKRAIGLIAEDEERVTFHAANGEEEQSAAYSRRAKADMATLRALVDRLTTPAPPATPAGDTDALVEKMRTLLGNLRMHLSPLVTQRDIYDARDTLDAIDLACSELADALAEAKQDTADAERWRIALSSMTVRLEESGDLSTHIAMGSSENVETNIGPWPESVRERLLRGEELYDPDDCLTIFDHAMSFAIDAALAPRSPGDSEGGR